MDARSLTGKTALITGAGRATALACAKRGARLALCDRGAEGPAETERLVRALGGERRVLAQRVDVADAEQMRAFARAALWLGDRPKSATGRPAAAASAQLGARAPFGLAPVRRSKSYGSVARLVGPAPQRPRSAAHLGSVS